MYTSNAFAHTACWSLLVLSVVCVSAGTDGNGIHLNGASQRAVSTAGSPRNSAAQAEPAPPTAPPAASTAQQRELADPSLAATAAKRDQLKYLVRCALPADVTVYTQQGAERFTFAGGLGLAPRWLDAAMTPSEERWVSACLLAHVNHFGKHILVSMRATPPPVPALESPADEQQSFTIFEGGFFGNLFLPEPVAYTCRGERTPAQASDPILQDRVCTQRTGKTTADGMPVTVCHFLFTGHCEDPVSFTVNGTYYSEVIFVYLKPIKQ
jgi:hypothetical protein